MMSIQILIRRLEKVISVMEKEKIRKASSMSLCKSRTYETKVTKGFLKDFLNQMKELQKEKTKVSLADCKDKESKCILQDFLEGNWVMDDVANRVILGVTA